MLLFTGNIDEARRILKEVEEAVPGLAMVRLRRVSLERRHENMDEAEALLRDAIASGRNSGESSFYAVKLARQLVKVQKSIDKAKTVLLEAVEKDEVWMISYVIHVTWCISWCIMHFISITNPQALAVSRYRLEDVQKLSRLFFPDESKAVPEPAGDGVQQ